MKRSRRQMELSWSIQKDISSVDASISNTYTSEDIDIEYISLFYNYDASIHYKYELVKPNQIWSLLNKKPKPLEDVCQYKRSQSNKVVKYNEEPT